MLTLHTDKQFQKDFDKVFQNASSSLKNRYKAVITALVEKTAHPHYFNAHPLHGNMAGFMEGHIKYDIVLIYEITDTDVYLVRIGSHTELFE